MTCVCNLKQHEHLLRFSDFLDEDEKYFIADEKAGKIIEQVLEKLEKQDGVILVLCRGV